GGHMRTRSTRKARKLITITPWITYVIAGETPAFADRPLPPTWMTANSAAEARTGTAEPEGADPEAMHGEAGEPGGVEVLARGPDAEAGPRALHEHAD